MSLKDSMIICSCIKTDKDSVVVFTLKYSLVYYSLVLVFLLLFSCKKMVHIDPPVSSITTENAFLTDANATSAVTGIYSTLMNTGTTFKFGSGAVSVITGLSADELSKVGIGGDLLQFKENNLTPQNGVFGTFLWGSAYASVYDVNACIEGLEGSKTITASLKNQLLGECKFLRAFLYFNLTNLWGDIPMPLTSQWRQTYLEKRQAQQSVYQQILSDLKEAQGALPEDYSVFNNERARATKYAATALLARVYLYQKDWANAELQSTAVINNTNLYDTVALANVFQANSKEAIFQFQPSNIKSPFAVVERYAITASPAYFLTNELLSAFEVGDKRRTAWVNSTVISGTTYYQPQKYKIRQGTSGGTVSEYYMVLRLAEQYLIRAEARAHQGKITEGKADLNVIRTRAGLSNTTASDQTSLLMAIEQERRIELFVEWGHRWFDLIRTGRAGTVLGPLKGTNWQATDVLYPIPFSEIQRNPNLTQNDGYN